MLKLAYRSQWSSSIGTARAIHLLNALLSSDNSIEGFWRKPHPILEKIAAQLPSSGSKMSSLSIEALLCSRALALHCCGKMMECYTVRTCAMHVVSPFCAFARFAMCTMLHVCKRSKEFLSNNVKAIPRCCALCSTFESRYARDCIKSRSRAICLLDINLLNGR